MNFGPLLDQLSRQLEIELTEQMEAATRPDEEDATEGREK